MRVVPLRPGRVLADGVRDRLQWAWLRRLCATGRRWRGAHGRWGRHVQGRHDLEILRGAYAPVTFACSASHANPHVLR
jgi:hypothetical protein